MGGGVLTPITQCYTFVCEIVERERGVDIEFPSRRTRPDAEPVLW